MTTNAELASEARRRWWFDQEFTHKVERVVNAFDEMAGIMRGHSLTPDELNAMRIVAGMAICVEQGA